MTDIFIEKKNGYFDFDIVNGDFAIEEGLATSIAISIYGHKRASAYQVPLAERRGGWIGNELAQDGFEQGSYLWLLGQSSADQQTANLFKAYIEDCLKWLVDDNIASSVSAVVEYKEGQFVASVSLVRANNITESYYFTLWEFTNERSL